ncbi:Transposable element P transposase [Amphibalanus amphitrite]|uniref:Transposable element P transposase n=1 Tax=Amphibalanus amphitrite TaxID=1232801 RepID=A0A6A4VCQ5_AMPAM|nr:Transposable element P transposase [Amphibalanus amphitrite]
MLTSRLESFQSRADCWVSPQGDDPEVENQENSVERLQRRGNRLKSTTWRQRQKIWHLKEQLRVEREKNSAEKVLEDVCKNMSKQAKCFFKLQVRTVGKDPHGRRYTDEELMYALAIYFQGPRAYRFLVKHFVLPSTRILRKNMQRVRLLPGFHDTVLCVLKEKFKSASETERLCVVSFDEMSVKTKMTYLRGEDMIEGTEDFGELGRSRDRADHALVFMVRGLTKKWKQSIGYFLSAGPTKAAIQKQLLVNCITKLQEVGLTVVATVCDMGPTNQQTYKLLGASEGRFEFEVGGQEVVALFDVPHLFKCLRNALLNYDVTVEGTVVSWNHLMALFHWDRSRKLRAAPKLRMLHLRPTPFKKMRVKLATQVMSRSVAAAMVLYADLANCEADSDGLIVGLNMTAARPERASARPMARLRSDDRVMPEPKVVLDVPVDEVTANCLSYVAGYLVHKANVVCRNCERALVRVDSEVRATADVLTALKSHTGVTKCDVGSLKLPSAVLFEFVRECYVSFSVHARSMLFETKILERLVRCVLASKPATVLASQLRCHPRVLTGIAARYMRLMLHSTCRELSSAAAKSGPRRQSRKLLKLRGL